MLKTKAAEKFYHRYISDIPRIKFFGQRWDWAKRQFCKVAISEGCTERIATWEPDMIVATTATNRDNNQAFNSADLLRNSLERPSAVGSSTKSKDTVSISQYGREQAEKNGADTTTKPAHSARPANDMQLDSQELQQLSTLKQRDREVRTHEQAHLSAAGQYARGGASFTFQKGPDGHSYAVGGEVGIDVGKERTPEATITKMQTIKRAALAPANPSQADRRIAAQAAVKEATANKELLQQRQEELLQSESKTFPAAADEKTAPRAEAEGQITASSYSSLKTVIAAYANAAAM